MDYIILDMEWNQPWPGSPTAKKPLPVQIEVKSFRSAPCAF